MRVRVHKRRRGLNGYDEWCVVASVQEELDRFKEHDDSTHDKTVIAMIHTADVDNVVIGKDDDMMQDSDL